MENLEKKMLSILDTFNKLDNLPITINVYTNLENDVKGFVHFAYVYYLGSGLKEKYKAKISSKYHSFDENVRLNIEFSAYESTEDNIILDKSKMLSQNLLKVVFYINDKQKMNKMYKIFINWGNNRQKPLKNTTSNELTMCIPPDDPTDYNYKAHMKQWFQFCKENPKYVADLKTKDQI